MKERIRGNAWKINWHEWSKEAFEKARKENKLILLSLSGVWCHWCHVMDETTYSDEEVIKLINENFIPIRVDVDERPDISERYNFGGYPTFAFLTYEGNLITGGTYIPPEQFKEILKDIIELSKSEKLKDLYQQQHIKRAMLQKGEVNSKIIWDIADILINSFDDVYGGFGIDAKFPLTDSIIFLENMYLLTKKEGFKIMFNKTLKGMLNGIYDNVEGGFFRYSVTRDWKSPHYEKMLETNSNLIKAYSIAFYLTNEESYRIACEKTVSYLLEKMFDPKEKLFYASQDADEEYYKKNLEERKKMKEPYKDPNLYSCYNAVCADSLLYCGLIFERDDLINLAKDVVETLINTRLKDKGIVHSLKTNSTYLNDNLLTLKLLNDIYQLSFDERYLTYIDSICYILINNFKNEYGLLKDKIPEENDFGLLKESYHPIQDNSLSIKELYLAGEILQKNEYKDFARNIASILALSYSRFNIFASSYANSLLFIISPIEARFVFSSKEKASEKAKEVKFLIHPSIFSHYVDIEKNKDQYEKEGIYICKGVKCYPPETEVPKISNLIEKINLQIIST